MHAASQLNDCRVCSLDAFPPSQDGEDLTLGDVLASRAEDPAVEAGRRLDWQGLAHKLDDVTRAVLRALADGSHLTRLVSRLNLRACLKTRNWRQDAARTSGQDARATPV